MFLRKISNHMKDQSWFAVVVDFVIVFVGVFVGLQAQDWSNARQFDQLERDYLAELADEIRLNNELTAGHSEMMALIVESGERAIEFLAQDKPCETECWPHVVDFFAASQVFFSPISTTVYDEMRRLGLLRTASIKPALSSYYVLSTTVFSSLDPNPAYRLRIRELLSVPAHRALWGVCHGVKDGIEFMAMDCPPGLPNEDTKALLERFRSDSSLPGLLNYWVGMHVLWTPRLGQIGDQGAAAVLSIEAALTAG
ncbi:MAG: hypothetical protein ACI8RN_001199 [Glaciecola sp.]|jgi:hypothetical protein|uniref:hypothetical protein n=1 Tax=Congregibacter sp. TaxID=2744308 RepID=UPI0039E2BC43